VKVRAAIAVLKRAPGARDTWRESDQETADPRHRYRGMCWGTCSTVSLSPFSYGGPGCQLDGQHSDSLRRHPARVRRTSWPERAELIGLLLWLSRRHGASAAKIR